MSTLRGGSRSARIASGASVLEAARTVDVNPITKRYAAFVAVHRRYVAADRQVQSADAALGKRLGLAGETDADQDVSVYALASALAGDGLPRINPFRPFGFAAPSGITGLGFAEEAREVLKLVKAVRKRPGLSKSSLAAAGRAERAARAVLAALASLKKLEGARKAAIVRRDALALPWEGAFAALKRGARAAEDDGATGLFAVLFERDDPPAAPRARAPKEPAPAPAPA